MCARAAGCFLSVLLHDHHSADASQQGDEKPLVSESRFTVAALSAQVHSDKDAMQRALVEAQSEKQAVMQAGEVLLAELEQLHEARDDAQRRLTGART